MSADFDEVRFPTDISEGAVGGPMYSTVVNEGRNGSEARQSLWGAGRCRYDIGYSLRTKAVMQTVVAFFRARGGRRQGFRFKDWLDYTATDEALPNPYPATTIQLQKTYSSGSASEVRRIYKPVAGTVVLKMNGVVKANPAFWTIDTTTGVVTIVGAFGGGDVFTWTGEFDVPVRFDTDRMAVAQEAVQINNWDGVPLIEILP